jgi:iron(III) transport system substrate-binding protein
MNRRRLSLLALIMVLLATQACSARPATTASTGQIAPPGDPTQAEWDQLVAAAKTEGVLVMAGPQGDENREALTRPFEERFGISVEYLGVGGPELPPKVTQERASGLYNWDVFMAGTTTLVRGLKPAGALEPIEPALLLPEVKDPTKWAGGKLPFFDADHSGVSVLRIAGQYFYRNTDQVRADEFKSWKDLLDPKWKGKIVVGRDPRVAGYGRSMFLFFYTHPELGPDYIRTLLRQDLVMLRDDRTAAQQLVQGQYSLCICSDLEVQRMIEIGQPAAVVDPRQMREGSQTTSAYGNVALANRAPHPNAAKLYVNWVLSKDGATHLVKASKSPSTRADVPPEDVGSWAIPEPNWPMTNTEEYLALEEPVVGLIVEMIGQ